MRRTRTTFISFLRGRSSSPSRVSRSSSASFVIANSLSITIAQRTREFATLRTIGASNRQVLGSIIVEALVVGVDRVGRRALPRAPPREGPLQALRRRRASRCRTLGSCSSRRTVVIALTVGILVTVLASVYPGFRATTVPPIAAVREGAALPGEPLDRIRGIWRGVVVTAAASSPRRTCGLGDAGEHARERLVAVLGLILVLFGCALFPSRTLGALVSCALGFAALAVRPVRARISARRACCSGWASACCSSSSASRASRRGSFRGSRPSCPRSRAGRSSCWRVLFWPFFTLPYWLCATALGARAVSATRPRVRRRRAHQSASPRDRPRDVAPQGGDQVGAGVAGGVPRRHPRPVDNSDRARERAAEPPAHGVDRSGADDRARARHAGGDARVGHRRVVRRRGERPLQSATTRSPPRTTSRRSRSMPRRPPRRRRGSTAVGNVRTGETLVFGKAMFSTAVDPECGAGHRADWKEGSQEVFSNLGENGVFVDDGVRGRPRPRGRLAVEVTFPNGTKAAFVVKGIFDPPTGGSPFGSRHDVDRGLGQRSRIRRTSTPS